MSTPKSELHDDAVSLEQNASEHTLALNPLISLRSEDLASSAQLLTKAAIEQPLAVAKAWMTILGDMVEVARGKKIREVESGDKRFKDPAWTNGAVHRAMLQGYLSWSNAMAQFVEESKLEPTDKARARLIAQIIVDAMSPSNTLLGNPAALKQFVDTGGESLLRGMKNFVTDLSENGGLPSMVDRSAFKVGKDIAATPGAVVFRNEMVELIQYNPTTPQVRQVPLVIAPPQINKYYALDLSPEKSLIRFALEGGFQTFCVSWRNPTPLHRHWGLEDYVQALDEAVDASRAITGAEQVSLMGSCSGGITASAYAGWLAARDEAKIANLILAVCVLDTATAPDIPGLGSFIAAETVEIAKQKSRSAGVLDGMEMAKVFAWMRPNDLIWNYWVNNYLLGNNPPAFDILFWNADTTRLPAQLHSDYLDMLTTNPFVISKNLAIKGSPVDMRKVKVNGYVIAGSTDHITPWKSVYRTARILGPETTFVLSNSGHLQSLLNPPSNPKASFAVGTADRKEADGFLAHAERRKESWWLHWRDWLYDRSGDIIEAPAELGSKEFRPDIPAPRFLRVRIADAFEERRIMLMKVDPPGLEIRTMKVGGRMLRVGIKPGPRGVPPLLLFNGIGASLELASTFMQSLAGLEVIIFDVPGIGGSPGFDLPYRLPAIARLGAELVKALGHDIVDVGGISWGGGVAQQFARQFPRLCRKLVLMATAPGSTMVPAKLSVLLKLASPRRYVDRSYMAAIAAEIYGGAFREDPALVASHAAATTGVNSMGYLYQLIAVAGWTSLPWLHLLRQPTLVLSGRDDPIVRPVNGWILATLIPNSTYHVLDDGHLFVVSQPDTVARMVESFLRR